MFGRDSEDGSDPSSDEATQPDPSAPRDVAPGVVAVTVGSGGDEKDHPPAKEKPAAAVAATPVELRAAGDAQEDGGTDEGTGADERSSSTVAASTDAADGSTSLGDKTNTGGVGDNAAAGVGGGGGAAGGGGGGGLFGVKPTGKLRVFTCTLFTYMPPIVRAASDVVSLRLWCCTVSVPDEIHVCATFWVNPPNTRRPRSSLPSYPPPVVPIHPFALPRTPHTPHTALLTTYCRLATPVGILSP